MLQLYFRFKYIRQFIWVFFITLVITVLVSLFFPERNTITRPVGWERSYYVVPAWIKTGNFDAAAKGKLVIVSYEGTEKGNQGIYVSISFNGGIFFQAPVKVADVNTVIANNPKVAISGNGHVFIVWQNHVVDEAANRIYYARSADMGATWSKAELLNTGYDMEMLPRVFYDDRNHVHIFYHGFSGGIINLYHSISVDETRFQNTGALMKLTADMKGAFFPAIQLEGRNIYLVWQGKGKAYKDDLFFMKSGNYGNSWSGMEKITSSKANDAAPFVLTKNNTIYLVYQNNEEKSWGIRLLIGQRNGRSWSEKPLKISETDTDCYGPKLAFSSKDTLLVTWYDSREGPLSIFSREYNVRKNKLGKEVKLSLKRGVARGPFPVTSGNKAVVFWKEGKRITAKYSDVYVKPPRVFSRTHPEGKWSRNSVARIEWVPPLDESGIVGYATIISKADQKGRVEDINPAIQNVKAGNRSIVLPGLLDGITYFHIRAIDGAGNFSRTIHYKIQVSANPLPMPVVVSPTHPQGKKIESASPVFRWAVGDRERLKGFVYSLSKDSATYPKKFTTDFEKTFNNLEKGVYFFSLSAIDRTNQRSQIADYYIVAGGAEAINPDDLLDKTKRKQPFKIRYLAKKPEVEINFPFDVSKPYTKTSFDAVMKIKNVKEKAVSGYSVIISRTKATAPEKLTTAENILKVENLTSGTYHLSARGRYARLKGRKKIYTWTEPFEMTVNVSIPVTLSPVQRYGERLIDRIGRDLFIVTFAVGFLTLITVMIGFGTRFVFYLKLTGYRLRILLKL